MMQFEVDPRRMALLKDLAARQTSARTARDAFDVAMEILATRPQDVSFALAYVDDDLQSCTPEAESKRAKANRDHVRELPIFLPGLDGHRVLEADILLAFLQLLGA